MLLNVCYLLAIFGNTPKVDTKVTMNEKKNEKSIVIIVYNASTSKRKRKEKKYDIKLRGSQVVLYVDQRGHVK